MRSVSEIQAELAKYPEAPPDNMSAASWFAAQQARAALLAELADAKKQPQPQPDQP